MSRIRPQAASSLPRVALLLACSLAVPAAVEWKLSPTQFYQSYLVAFLFVLAPTLGALAWILLHRLTGGRWGTALIGVLEPAAARLPFVALLFLPLLLGLDKVFPWAAPGALEASSLPLHQQHFLQRPYFVARAALYFSAWVGLAWMVSTRRSRDSAAGRHPAALAAVGLLLYFVTATLASVDWGMSLSPGWYSSLYGLLTIVATALSALTAAILLRVLLARTHGQALPADTLHDLGNLLLACVMTWAYLAFSQLLIMWSANLPEEVGWYVDRLAPGWATLALVLVLAHFLVPFFLLLLRSVKRRMAWLAGVSALIFAARLPEVVWMIVPSLSPQRFEAHWLDFVLPACLLCAWTWLVLRDIEGRLSSGSTIPLAELQTA